MNSLVGFASFHGHSQCDQIVIVVNVVAMSALYDYHLEGLGGYQEFDRYPGEETVYVDCPTCRGKGRINTSSEKNQLISLGRIVL